MRMEQDGVTLPTRLVALARSLGDKLGLGVEDTILIALETLQGSTEMGEYTEWDSAQVRAIAGSLKTEHPRGFTLNVLLDALADAGASGVVLEPHAEKIRLARLLRAMGFESKLIRYKGTRQKRWYNRGAQNV